MRILAQQAITVDNTNVAGSTYPNYNSATTYASGSKVYIPDIGVWGEYKCRVDGTKGIDPRTSIYNASSNPDGKWEYLGVTNCFRMFDQFGGTRTVNPKTIETSVTAIETDGIFLGNIDAFEVTINVIDSTTAEVIETALFELYPDVEDWQDYFYGKWLNNCKRQVTYERDTLTRNISYHIKIDNGDNEAGCGIAFIGELHEFGYAKLKVELGVEDYSPIVKDVSTGATYVQQGNYAKVMGFDIFTSTGKAPRVFDMLTRFRGTPIVMSQENFELFNVYGYFQSYKILIEDEQETAITGTVMGLI